MASRSGDERPSQVYRRGRRFRSEAKALGERIRALRMEQGWTLEQAAEASGLDLKHFQKLEAAALNPTLVTLTRVAAGFGVEIASLFQRPPLAKTRKGAR